MENETLEAVWQNATNVPEVVAGMNRVFAAGGKPQITNDEFIREMRRKAKAGLPVPEKFLPPLGGCPLLPDALTVALDGVETWELALTKVSGAAPRGRLWSFGVAEIANWVGLAKWAGFSACGRSLNGVAVPFEGRPVSPVSPLPHLPLPPPPPLLAMPEEQAVTLTRLWESTRNETEFYRVADPIFAANPTLSPREWVARLRLWGHPFPKKPDYPMTPEEVASIWNGSWGQHEAYRDIAAVLEERTGRRYLPYKVKQFVNRVRQSGVELTDFRKQSRMIVIPGGRLETLWAQAETRQEFYEAVRRLEGRGLAANTIMGQVTIAKLNGHSFPPKVVRRVRRWESPAARTSFMRAVVMGLVRDGVRPTATAVEARLKMADAPPVHQSTFYTILSRLLDERETDPAFLEMLRGCVDAAG